VDIDPPDDAFDAAVGSEAATSWRQRLPASLQDGA
jgi:hypothetical protein